MDLTKRKMLKNYFDLLFKSWSDSLRIFLPNNLKNFVLVTLNAYKQLWANLVNSKIIYALIFVYILSLYLSWKFESLQNLQLNLILFIYFYTCGCRPSIKNKDWSYFKDKFFHYIFTYLFFILIISFLFYIVSLISDYFKPEITLYNSKILLTALPYIFIYILLFQLLICLTLFLFDSEKLYNLLKMLKSALTMFWYNLPFFLASIILFSLLFIGILLVLFCLAYLTKVIGLQDLLRTYFKIDWKDFAVFGFLILIFFLINLCLFFIIPLYICWIANFYIKRLHEQFSLYYKS